MSDKHKLLVLNTHEQEVQGDGKNKRKKAIKSKERILESKHTDKKENQTFLICKEIQNEGAVAKSYMTNGLLIYREIFTHFLIYDFATAPL